MEQKLAVRGQGRSWLIFENTVSNTLEGDHVKSMRTPGKHVSNG